MLNLFFPNIAYASVDNFIHSVNKLILNPLIILLFALAAGFFVYGVVEFLANQSDEAKRTAGKNHMIWGIIGIAIMISVWTLMNLILDTFNIKGIDPKAGKVELNVKE